MNNQATTTDQQPRKSKGRPCRNYPCPVYIRATPEERERIYALARERRLSVSRFLVRMATEGKAPPTLEERDELRTLRYLLLKVGNNLNQIAHRANRAALRGDPPPPAEEIRAVVKGVEMLSRELRKRLK